MSREEKTWKKKKKKNNNNKNECGTETNERCTVDKSQNGCIGERESERIGDVEE